MNTEKCELLIEALTEYVGWGVTWSNSEGYLLLQNESPLGVDISFKFEYDDEFVESDIVRLHSVVNSLCESFDSQEQAVILDIYYLHSFNGDSTNLEELLHDALMTKNTLSDLESILDVARGKVEGDITYNDIINLSNLFNYEYDIAEMENDISNMLKSEYDFTDYIIISILSKVGEIFNSHREDYTYADCQTFLDECLNLADLVEDCIKSYVDAH